MDKGNKMNIKQRVDDEDLTKLDSGFKQLVSYVQSGEEEYSNINHCCPLEQMRKSSRDSGKWTWKMN